MALNAVRIVSLLALLAAIAAAWEGWQLVRIHEWNAAIRAGRSVTTALPVPPEVRFSDAYLRAARGDVQGALDAYRALHDQGDRRLRHAAMFNGANLYLQQSAAASGDARDTSALTLVELAKQSYRELLRDDSEDWDARYNLELALRAAPDPEETAVELPPPPEHRNTPSTASGATLGLP